MKSRRSTTGTRLPRTLAMPSSHALAPGTPVSAGGVRISLTSAMLLTK
jgi:hypothetical protein